MKAKRSPLTEFGLQVSTFCARYGFTKKQLAAEAGVPYDSLLQASKGNRAGHTTKAAVLPVMARYEAQELEGRGGISSR